MTGVFIKQTHTHTNTHRLHMNIKAEIRGDASISQGISKIAKRPPETGEESWKSVPHRSQNTPPSQTSSLCNWDTIKFLCFNPPVVWYFVIAALRN